MAGIAKANEEAISRAQTIKKIKIILDDFSEPTSGELTATLKLKRSVVNKKYAAEIESLYTGSK